MDRLIIQTGEPYQIYFSKSYGGLSEAFREAKLLDRKVAIITDNNVESLYLNAVKDVLGDVPSFAFCAGEGSKHIGTLQEMYKFFVANKLDRRSVVVALGGGVVGDLVGFAAATFMRGIDFVVLPTTLLAQVDAGVGGKTAIDFEGVKNLIGAFHQPKLVYINLTTLNTLPPEEFASGMGEVIKHGLIGGADYYEYIHKHRQDIKNLDLAVLSEVVSGSCRIKAAVVALDERESGPREILNFGHCVGHAIESLSGYSIQHGCCVAIGMCAALRLSDVTEPEIARAVELMKYFDLPTSCFDYSSGDSSAYGADYSPGYNADYSPEKILQTMYKDKKTINDTLRVVLLKRIGEAYTNSTIPPARILEVIS